MRKIFFFTLLVFCISSRFIYSAFYQLDLANPVQDSGGITDFSSKGPARYFIEIPIENWNEKLAIQLIDSSRRNDAGKVYQTQNSMTEDQYNSIYLQTNATITNFTDLNFYENLVNNAYQLEGLSSKDNIFRIYPFFSSTTLFFSSPSDVNFKSASSKTTNSTPYWPIDKVFAVILKKETSIEMTIVFQNWFQNLIGNSTITNPITWRYYNNTARNSFPDSKGRVQKK